MKIAIIGAGNMGGSIARGLAKGSLIDDSDIIVSNPSAGKLEKLKKEFPGISITNSNVEAATGADIVILAVKPWFMEPVMRELKLKSKQILISVAAGISFEELAHYVVAPEMAMFRLIPNTAISELESMTLVAARNTNDEQDKFILRLFSEMGTVMLIPEDKIAAATALTSCGIAYVLKYVQAAMQAGIEMGLRPKDAMQMIAQSLKGAAALIQPEDRPRQCVFCGTSNDLNFLPLDRTGNRRFAPVMTDMSKAVVHILDNEAESKAYIEQAWAEAMVLYRQGKVFLGFTKEIEEEAKRLQKEFMPEDTNAGIIQAFLDDYDDEYVCTRILFDEALHRTGEMKQWEGKEIANIMNNAIEGWKPHGTHRFGKEYGIQSSWKRMEDSVKKDKDGFMEVPEQLEIPFE